MTQKTQVDERSGSPVVALDIVDDMRQKPTLQISVTARVTSNENIDIFAPPIQIEIVKIQNRRCTTPPETKGYVMHKNRYLIVPEMIWF